MLPSQVQDRYSDEFFLKGRWHWFRDKRWLTMTMKRSNAAFQRLRVLSALDIEIPTWNSIDVLANGGWWNGIFSQLPSKRGLFTRLTHRALVHGRMSLHGEC